MEKMIVLAFVVVTLLHATTCQGPPPQCRGPPRNVEKPHECCKVPPIFSEEDLKECGIEMPSQGGPPSGPPGSPPPGPPPRGPPPSHDCSKLDCIINKYKLGNDDGSINFEAAENFLKSFAEKNPAFSDVIGMAVERCLQKDLPGPPEVCEASKVVFCVSSTIFMNCPNWVESDNCNILKAHMEECKKYFVP